MALLNTILAQTPAVADTFYFTTYTHKTGDYAVKVIKIVA